MGDQFLVGGSVSNPFPTEKKGLYFVPEDHASPKSGCLLESWGHLRYRG